ncbi:CUB and sushi domain-containing protein 3 [Biomphalaria pfeifferi]|uniref:CUB and sushi domain-containing protein 3 n=1 Tax=Biomphalaria pfeifferi TaxID=112525 RepID=A0AAD8BLF2_BIOPF|nr:CUB and sushi domain-containing protein 3 [Biomphalaria pfeifferi]
MATILIRSFALSLFLVCSFSISINHRSDVRNLVTCYSVLSDRLGSVTLDLRKRNHDQCVWEINVESAISLSVYIRSLGRMASSKFVDVSLYNQHPATTNQIPLVVWKGKEEIDFAETFDTSQLWIIVHCSNAETAELNIVLDYATHTVNNISTCTLNLDTHSISGRLNFKSSSLGSKARLKCHPGYIMINGNGELECKVENGQLVWSGDNAICDSGCKHPMSVQHATYEIEYSKAYIEMPHGGKSSSVVKYSCSSLYQMIGEGVTRCQHDINGLPKWSHPPPLCLAQDCSTTYTLTSKTGTIFSPKSTGGGLKGGSLNCKWEILAHNSDINVTVLYSDLPSGDGVNLVVSDAESRPLLTLSGTTSGVRNVISGSLKLTVMYIGPKKDVENHSGFLLEYLLVPQKARNKRATQNLADPSSIDSSTVNTNVTTDGVSAFSTILPISAVPTQTTTVVSASTSVVQSPMTTQANSPSTSPQQPFISPALQTSDTPSFQTDVLETTNQRTDIIQPTEYIPDITALVNKDSSLPLFLSSSTTVETNTTDTPILINTGAVILADINTTLATAVPENSESSSDGWKIALGIILSIIGICLIALGGYISYRKKYPVRMIIGREFGKFSNPIYDRSKRPVSLVVEDADEYFARNTGAVTPDDLNPVNQNFHYVNQAFVNEEDDEEKDRKFIQKKQWMFSKQDETLSSRPLSEITLSSYSSEGNDNSDGKPPPKSDSTDSMDKEMERLLSKQQRTPRIKPKRKKLHTRLSSSSIETLSDTASMSESLDLQEGQLGSIDTASQDHEITSETYNQKLEENNNAAESNINKGSNYMKIVKLIFEQPSFEEVCAEARSRSRSLTFEPNLPEKRMRSYSVDPFKSARKSSFTGAPENVQIVLEDIHKVTVEMLGRSTTSISSIISESSIIDESMLEGLPITARERCLSMTSQNSNRHLVTDLDTDSIGGSSHKSDLNTNDSPLTESKQSVEDTLRLQITSENSNGSKVNEINRDEDFTEEDEEEDVAPCLTERTDYESADVQKMASLDDMEAPETSKLVQIDEVDDEEYHLEKQYSIDVSLSSRSSSLSVSSGQSVSTITDSESGDHMSYSFENTGLTGAIETERNESQQIVEETSSVLLPEREPVHVSFSELPPPPLPSPIPSTEDSVVFNRFLSSDLAPEISAKIPSITRLEISESSSDTSDVERPRVTLSPTAVQMEQSLDSLSSSDDEDAEHKRAKLTVEDIANVLDVISDSVSGTHEEIQVSKPTDTNADNYADIVENDALILRSDASVDDIDV